MLHSLVYGVSFIYNPKFTHIDAITHNKACVHINGYTTTYMHAVCVRTYISIHNAENQTIAFHEMNSEILSY